MRPGADHLTERADALDLPAHAGGLKRLDARRLRLPDDFSTGPGRLAALRFTVGQAVLGFGGGEAAAVRAWYRRLRWAQRRREKGLAGALRWLAGEPLRAVRETRTFANRYGPVWLREFGVPVRTQRRHLLWLRLVHGTEAESYYQFQLFRSDRRRKAALYLQQPEAAALYRVLAYREAADDYLVLENKQSFARWCAAHALPTAPTLAELTAGGRDGSADVRMLRAALDGARGSDLFSKPVDANKGRGAVRWTWDLDGWRDDTGRAHDADALAAALAAQAQEGVLLQQCLENDPALAPVAGRALCTVRLITARPPGGAPEITQAGFRTGVGRTATDNLATGGIAAAVDIHTGRLGTAMRPYTKVGIAVVDRHPDTGVEFAGFPLPHWDAAAALVRRAHGHLRALGFVGWDVALTPAGPVLVEGNFSPGTRLAQAPSGVPLGETNHLRYLDAHLRRSYARGRA